MVAEMISSEEEREKSEDMSAVFIRGSPAELQHPFNRLVNMHYPCQSE